MNKNRFTFGAIVAAAGLLGGAVACSSSGGGGGGGTVTGTVGGVAIKVASSISAKATDGSGSDTETFGLVLMTSVAGACDAIETQDNTGHKGMQTVFIQLANVDANAQTVTAPTAPGTFNVFDSSGSGAPPAMAAVIQVSQDDATCMEDTAKSSGGTTGTVTLTAVSGDKFTGTYDATLANGDHITGSFSPAACTALESIFQQDTGSGSGSSGSGSGSAPVCE